MIAINGRTLTLVNGRTLTLVNGRTLTLVHGRGRPAAVDPNATGR